jgi:hypothetical protein
MVQIGALPPSAPSAIWYPDRRTLACQQVKPADVVAELWPVVGATWRDGLLALGHAVRRGNRSVRDFLRHHEITESMLADADSQFGVARLVAPFLQDRGQELPGASDLPRGSGSERRATEPEPGGEGETEEPIDLDAAQERVRSAPASLGHGAVRGGGTFLPGATGRSPAPGPARYRDSVDDEYSRRVGHLGEHFAFRALSKALPGFDASCWKSSSRVLAGLPAGDDSLGYDFRYIDTSGALSGEPGAECLIEVKANAREPQPRFAMSNNEWRLAEACHQSQNRRFIVVRVAGIADAPEVVAVIVDPVRAREAGELSLRPKNGWWVEHDVAAEGGESGEVRDVEEPE